MRLRIVIFGLALSAVLVAPVGAQEADRHRAGLVVVHGDGGVATACVTFSEDSITGDELLQRSGLGVRLGAYGGLGYGVCAIDGEGCIEEQDCFCQCRSSPCAYWVYSHRQPDGSWAVSGVGASAWQVRNGAVDGWVWGDGSSAPPTISFEEICPLEEEVTAATPVPSPVPLASPDITPVPLPFPEAPAGAPAEQTRQDSPLLGYGIFAAILLGLVIGAIVLRHRGRFH